MALGTGYQLPRVGQQSQGLPGQTPTTDAQGNPIYTRTQRQPGGLINGLAYGGKQMGNADMLKALIARYGFQRPSQQQQQQTQQ